MYGVPLGSAEKKGKKKKEPRVSLCCRFTNPRSQICSLCFWFCNLWARIQKLCPWFCNCTSRARFYKLIHSGFAITHCSLFFFPANPRGRLHHLHLLIFFCLCLYSYLEYLPLLFHFLILLFHWHCSMSLEGMDFSASTN